MRVLVVGAALLLTGCASYHWENPALSGAEASRQLQIDGAECIALAMREAPEPTPPPPPAQTNVTVYGDGNGGAVVTNSSNGYLEGVEAYQAMAAASRADQARRAIGHACMLQRGWVKVQN